MNTLVGAFPAGRQSPSLKMRQKKRRRDADAADSDADYDAQRTAAASTVGCNHRLSRHTAAAHALLLLLSANLMFGIDAFSHESALQRNNFGRATCDVPTFCQNDANGPAAGAFSNTIRYHRSGAAMIQLSASRERTDTSSSSSANSSSSSSWRFGVRKRVKSVIQKAKSRKIAKAARAEAAVAEAEIQHIIEEDDKLFEETKGKSEDNDDINGEIDIEIQGALPETEEKVEEVNGAAAVAQAEKETDTDGDTEIASSSSPLVEEDAVQVTDESADSESQSASPSKEEEVTSATKTPEDANDKKDDDDEVANAEPLPFELPKLTDEQQRQLDMGERVQFQNDMGREGSGFVVLDVKAPPDVVWECLLDFQSYPETIPTVREVTMYTNTHLSGDYRSEKPVAFEDGTMATLAHGIPSVTRAAFTLSKFRLKIAAIHRYTPHPVGDYMVFTLDPACTNLVLKDAKGIWHTQSNPDNKGEVSSVEEGQNYHYHRMSRHELIFSTHHDMLSRFAKSIIHIFFYFQQEYTRVWLLCEVKVSKLLPQWITDYAARRAMPRATTWLRPQVEAANALWLSKKRRRRKN